jgi:peptidoglycan/LPS O-acetylase OafA/YrhL
MTSTVFQRRGHSRGKPATSAVLNSVGTARLPCISWRMNPAPDQRVPALDGLRGMAALMVVVSHVSNSTGLWGNLLGNGGGQVGVMIFFVLSGYLIGALYLGQPFTLANVWEYGVRRVARVVPAFYALLSLALILRAVSDLTGWNLTIYPVTLEQSVAHYALLSGIGVFWTIPVEMHFYAVFVAAWWLYSRSSLAMIAAAVLVIVVYWSLPVQVPQDPRTLPYYLVFFLVGLLISRVVAMRDVYPSGPLPILAGLGFFLPFLLYPNVYAGLFGRSDWLLSGDLQQMWHDPRYPIAAGLCLVAAVRSPFIKAALSRREMIYLGKISYSVYLLHFPVIELLLRFTSLSIHPMSFLVVTLVLTGCAASISYLLVEQPGSKLVRRAAAYVGGGAIPARVRQN